MQKQDGLENLLKIPIGETLPAESKKDNRKVLLLNASEEPLRLISWQRAICLLVTERARKPFNFEDYYDIRAVSCEFKIPSAIVLSEFVHIPRRKIRPTRRNIFIRDGLIDQYTGEHLSFKDASVDHIIPTSKGGKNVWENVVTCSKKVNARKGDRTLEESGLKLLSKPKAPTHSEIVIGAATKERQGAWSRWLY